LITTPPAPAAARPLHFPDAVETVLDNGLRVVAVTQRNLPLVAAHLMLRCGAVGDPPELPGLATMTATLLTQGAGSLGASEIAQRVDALGARLDAVAGYDASTLSVMATTTKFRAAFELAGIIVGKPTFAIDDLERIRAKALSDLKLTYGSPGGLARLVASRVAFGEGPYAHPLAGTPSSLPAITRDDIAGFYRSHYVPSRATLLIGGDLEPEEAIELAREVLGSWHDPKDVAVEPPAGVPPPPRFVVVDQPAAGRTAIVTAHPAICRNADDYYEGVVSTAILSGYSGRLNQEVRVKRGLSYGAGAQLMARRRGGLFTAATLVDHRKAAEATEVVRATLRSLIESPPNDNELGTRKTNVLGNFARSVETIEGLLSAFGEYALYDIGLDEIRRFEGKIESVDAGAVASFARHYISLDPSIVLVGRADEFTSDLARFGRDLERIPFDALDLGRASLRAS
jgi:zinc protease